jgi:hypothetical protein
MAYKLGALGRDLRRDLLDEIEHRQVDLNRCQRPGWWHRPFTAAELAQHPDRERIYAMVEAAAAQLIRLAIDAVIDEGR